MVTGPEFSREVDPRHLPTQPLELAATPEECRALARRFGLVKIARLEATLELAHHGETVAADGRMSAAIVQSCAISGEDLLVAIDEPLHFRFVPERPVEEEEIELGAEDLDEIPYDGQTIDVGEAVAQSLALAIDPYAVGPEAERVRKEAGLNDEAASGPFAALAALKKD